MSTDSTELGPGERIVWSGEPSRHRLLRPEDALLIPFSLIWGAIAIFSMLDDMVAGDRPPVFSAVWGVLGLSFIVGRFIVRKMALSNTRYVITDSRVVVTGGVTGTRLHTFYLASLGPPVIKEYSDGSGDLAFVWFRVRLTPLPSALDRIRGQRSLFYMWGEPFAPPRLRDIPQVRHVRDLVLAAQTEARRGNPTA